MRRESSAGIALRDACADPALFLLEYSDGFKAALLHAGSAKGLVNGWAYAAKLPTGQLHATGLTSTGATTRRGGPARGPPYPHFSYLSLNVQEMFLTGKAQCESYSILVPYPQASYYSVEVAAHLRLDLRCICRACDYNRYPAERTLLVTGQISCIRTSLSTDKLCRFPACNPKSPSIDAMVFVK